MNTYLDLSMGLAGIISVVAAYTREDFSYKGNDIAALSGLIVVAVALVLGIPDEFVSFSAASSTNIFGFIGRFLGLISCVRVLFLRFPNLLK